MNIANYDIVYTIGLPFSHLIGLVREYIDWKWAWVFFVTAGFSQSHTAKGPLAWEWFLPTVGYRLIEGVLNGQPSQTTKAVCCHY